MRCGLAFWFLLLCGTAVCQQTAACAPPPKPLPSFRSGSITVPGGSIYYEEQGAGPAVVLIHGGYNDRRLWDTEFAAFARRFHVVRYDIRGYGKAQSDNSRFSPTADLLTLFDTLKIKKASLVGLSLGGMIAAEFAIAHPERVDKLVLVSSGLPGMKYGKDYQEQQQAFWAKVQACQTHECSVDTMLSGPLFATGMKDSCYAQRARRMMEDNWKSLGMLGKMDWPQPPMLERLSRIKAPTLIVAGAADDRAILANAAALKSGIPHAKEIVFPGVSHHLNMEIPSRFDAAVLRFLQHQ